MNTPHVIPPITDPLGRHWSQPPRDRILVDDTHALMSQADFEQLPEYSRSVPTGAYAGKMWRCHFREGWFLCWYADDVPGRVKTQWRPLLVVA